MDAKLLSFPKVRRIDKPVVKHILNDEVVVTEKLDGSQFRILLTRDGFDVGSKNVDGIDNVDSMFSLGVKRAEEVWRRFVDSGLPDEYGNMVIYTEYLSKEKHNTLSYSKIPVNNLYLFGMYLLNHENEAGIDDMNYIAKKLDIDAPNVIFTGKLTLDELQELIKQESYFGGTLMEGAVIINYNQYALAPYDELRWRLRAKMVREDFKELNHKEWKEKKKDISKKFLDGFVTYPRLIKVLHKLEEEGKLVNEMVDLPLIFEEYWRDLLEEESDTLAELLVKEYKRKAEKKIMGIYKNILQEGGR